MGKSSLWRQGKIFFPELPYAGSLSFVRKSSLISANYFLSLQASLPLPDQPPGSTKAGRCYLNRFGSWRIKSSDKILTSFYKKVKQHTDVATLCKKTDFDAVLISSDNSTVTLFLNLYGGGYLSLLFPPMHFKVAISDEQISYSAAFFKTLMNILTDG
ncbi:hypothetical protein [uncultured Desulfobacter sp.]|uniref:hypothetical protein n=1 Tax=uncultured Desulfobacter sp. TaxID=240139 RepID=UPI002AA8929C|nr:hypothetical protein [uncultured Desulfobacter sp.]